MKVCRPIRQPIRRRNGATNGVPSSVLSTGATTDSYAPFTISLSQTYMDQSGLISGLKVPITVFFSAATTTIAPSPRTSPVTGASATMGTGPSWT